MGRPSPRSAAPEYRRAARVSTLNARRHAQRSTLARRVGERQVSRGDSAGLDDAHQARVLDIVEPVTVLREPRSVPGPRPPRPRGTQEDRRQAQLDAGREAEARGPISSTCGAGQAAGKGMARRWMTARGPANAHFQGSRRLAVADPRYVNVSSEAVHLDGTAVARWPRISGMITGQVAVRRPLRERRGGTWWCRADTRRCPRNMRVRAAWPGVHVGGAAPCPAFNGTRRACTTFEPSPAEPAALLERRQRSWALRRSVAPL